ncbi:MAG: SagB/ThcOx family dehydrogenase [Candidatus Omnitrophota bacterium]
MKTIKLPRPKLKSDISLEETITKRRSVRSYSRRELTLNQIGQLLWACQGITDSRPLRAAPSAGACYPLEVYIAKEDGLYRYVPEGHLIEKKSDSDLRKELAQASWGQRFVEEAPVNIIICAVYERVTSRYGKRGIRYTDIEVGHAAENVHLEAVSLGLSSCPVGAFNDKAVSKILDLPDGEKPVYIIPVGYAEE